MSPRNGIPEQRRGLFAPTIAFAVALAILVGLGTWQLKRLAWKTGIIAMIAERTTAPPKPIPPESAWSALIPDEYDYRHVTLTGRFDHAKEAHVFRPLSAQDSHGPYSGVGDLVLTPLTLADGSTVIVNRGFVPQDKLEADARKAGQVEGLTTMTGLMRAPESRNLFTPSDDPRHGTGFTRDPAAIARYFTLSRVAPFTVDADTGQVPGGLPQGGETVLSIPNNHLSYALTWFGLAGGLCLVFVAFVWSRINAGSPLPNSQVQSGTERV